MQLKVYIQIQQQTLIRMHQQVLRSQYRQVLQQTIHVFSRPQHNSKNVITLARSFQHAKSGVRQAAKAGAKNAPG